MINEIINKYAFSDYKKILEDFSCGDGGLDKHQIEANKHKFGTNKIKIYKEGILFRLNRAFINPFSIVLFILGFISLLTDVILSETQNYTTFIITISMVLISGIIRFIQELHSKKITDDLIKLVDSHVTVIRENLKENVSYDELVVGDRVYLKAGDKVPADIRIIQSQDLFVSESIITGESSIKEKDFAPLNKKVESINDYTNILFQGTNVISGNGVGIVLAVGEQTFNENFSLDKLRDKHGYNKKSDSIVWVLIKFMLVLVPLVFVASGLTKGNWLESFLFALSVAVGLTPELLPMIITACLAKSSHNMAKKETIVKNINAMSEFGTMDVLCLDKTGTLTQDRLVLEYYMDVLGNESIKTLESAYINSYFSSGIKNHLDTAILDIDNNNFLVDKLRYVQTKFIKIDELPFDYDRKISSVLLKEKDKKFIISKGSIKEIISRCKYIEYKNKKSLIKENTYESVNSVVDEMLADGMKVIAVAYKEENKEVLTPDNENNLTLLGYIAFFDAPKSSALGALKKINNMHIKTKILTGDDNKVTLSIAKRLEFNTNHVLTGLELDNLNDNEAQMIVENTDIFTELSPNQKEKIISILKSNGHTVGFLGDGMNDLKAMNEANVSISVENASPALKQSADVVLLKKDLDILSNGVVEGRKSFINMNKYIKITASSNLGNILAIVICSIFLPFFPMTSIQLLLLNLFYDVLCLVIPFDKVDNELIKTPSSWDNHKLTKFMLCFGPISSLFDIATFAFLFYYICPTICGGDYNSLTIVGKENFVSLFQTGWFLESMWTQILILHLLRTNKLPFIQSKPSVAVTIITIIGIILFTAFAITPIGNIVNLTALPWVYFIFLIGVVLCYLFCVSLMKRIYIKYNKSIL